MSVPNNEDRTRNLKETINYLCIVSTGTLAMLMSKICIYSCASIYGMNSQWFNNSYKASSYLR